MREYIYNSVQICAQRETFNNADRFIPVFSLDFGIIEHILTLKLKCARRQQTEYTLSLAIP